MKNFWARVGCWWHGKHCYSMVAISNTRFEDGLVVGRDEHYQCIFCQSRKTLHL